MSYRCTKGCKAKDRRGDWHDSKSQCPFEEKYQAPLPSNPPLVDTGDGVKVPVTDQKSATPPPATTRGEPRPKVQITGLRIASEGPPAQVQSRSPLLADKPTVEIDWRLDPTYARRAWNLFFGGWLWSLDAVGEWFEYGPVPPEKREAFKLTGFENTSLNEDPDSYMCRIPTYVLKWAGATSLQEAQNMIDDAEFLTFLGKPLLYTGQYAMGIYRDSPKLKKARDAAEAEAKRRASAIDTTGRVLTPTPEVH